MAENVTKETERAHRIQYNALSQMYSIENEAKLRQKVNLQSSIQGLQKQMQREIAQALKRSQSKVKYLNEKAHERYHHHLRQPLKPSQVNQYNKLVKSVETARWEYIVHRHSCGFTIRNYQIVTEMFRLPPLISEKNAVCQQ